MEKLSDKTQHLLAVIEEEATYLSICEALAAEAAKKGNPAVGCIIVRQGEMIAQAEEATKSKGDITCHAEMEAIRVAVAKIGKDLSACSLYSTHEPCVMCGYAIRRYGISQVVIQSPVAYLGSVSSEFALLTTLSVPPHWPPPPEIVWMSKSDE